MAKGDVNVKITGDPSSAKRALNDVGTSAHSLSGKFSGLMGTVGKLAGAFAGLMVAREVGRYLKSAAEAAMEDAKGKEVLHTAIKNVTGATEDELVALDKYIEKTQAATGFTEEDLRPALTKLTAATKDVGKAQDLLAIAMDVSTARGTSLETVTLALEKAQNGQLTGLQRLGIQTKDASGKTLEFDQILKNLADTYGGATAAAADTFAGKMERMKLIFGEIKESIGAAMLPALEKIATVIMDNMPAFESLATTFSTVIAGALDFVATTVLPNLQAVFEKVWPIVQKAMQGFVDWISSPSGQSLINSLLDGIGVVLGALQSVFETVWPIIQSAVKGFVDWLSGSAGQALINLLLDGIGLAAQALQTIFETVWPILQDVVGAFIGWFNSSDGQKIVAELLDGLKALMGALRDLWNAAWPAMEAALTKARPVIEATLGAIVLAVQIVAAAIRAVIDAYEEMERIMGSGGNTVNQYGGYTAPGGNTSIYNKGQVPDFTKKNPNLLQRAEGGPIPGSGPVPLIGHGGEYVLTKGDTSLMKQLIAAVGGKGAVNNNQRQVNINVSGNDGIVIGRQIATILGGI